MSFAFRFYGARPAEWFDGGAWPYAVLFAGTPMSIDVDESACIEVDPPLVSGAWALFTVRERRGAGFSFDAFFADVHAFFSALHAKSPLLEVVCFQVSEEGELDPWTAWSVAQQPDPTPGPRWSSSKKTAKKTSKKPLDVWGRRQKQTRV